MIRKRKRLQFFSSFVELKVLHEVVYEILLPYEL